MSQQTQTERLTPSQDSPEKQKYQDQLSAVLNQSLTPENIDSYADDALDQLVGIVDKVISDYQTGHPEEPNVFKDLKVVEDKAFSHYGLTGLNDVLDNVARLSNNLSRIDAIVANAIPSPTVILGTDPNVVHEPIEAGDGSFTEKKLVARLKTILFVLQEDFNLDIEDTEKVNLTPGVMKTGMMRKETYYSVEIRDLNKTVVVCDEEDNITFVLNDAYLRENGISAEDVNNLYKSDLTDLIKADPKVGLRIIYSNAFVDKLVQTLSDDDPFTGNDSYLEDDSTGVERTYLYPKAPEGYLSKQSIADQLGVQPPLVARAITALGKTLGNIGEYKFRSRTAPGYSPEQIEQITSYLTEKGLLSDHPPEGYVSMTGISDQLGVHPDIVISAITALGKALGEVGEFKYYSRTAKGYSPEQIEQITSYLTERGLIVGKPPEGYLSKQGIADRLEVSPPLVGVAITALGDKLNSVIEYKFGNMVTRGYSPDQIDTITSYLTEKGLLSDHPPEGYMSKAGIAYQLGVARKTVGTAATALSGELGRVDEYKFGSNITDGYSPEQIEIIIQYIESRRKSKVGGVAITSSNNI